MGVYFNGIFAVSFLFQLFKIACWKDDVFIPVYFFG